MTNDHEHDHDFTKKTVRKFGPRGSPVFEQEEKTTDLENLAERVEQTAVPFCNCGAPISGTADVYRCCECEMICCTRCEVRLSRRHFCPLCAQRQFALDKRTFLALVFLQQDTLAFEDLFEVTTQAGDVIEIGIDGAADAIVAQGYLADDGTLSDQGREALHVGHQLYGEDEDVQAVLDQLRVASVVEQR
jgi:hypothetical protein